MEAKRSRHMFDALTPKQLAALRDKIDSGERKAYRLDNFLIKNVRGYSNLSIGVLDVQLDLYRLGTAIRDEMYDREEGFIH